MSAAQDPLFFGPDPVPRRSAEFPVPPGACDAHAHVVGPHDTYRLSGARPGIRPPEALLSDYMAMLDALGIERAVLVQPSAYSTDNTLLPDCLTAHPERLPGLATPDLDRTDARRLAELSHHVVPHPHLNHSGTPTT